jgi:acetyltransferase-like isoleucine patch superfamily enzyme
MLCRQLPGPLGLRLRYRYWRRRLGALGEGVRIDEGVQIVNPEHVFIGSGCWLATGAFIGAGPPSVRDREVFRRENGDFACAEGEVHLGDHVYLAPGSLINGHGGVEIRDNTEVGAAAHVYSMSHHYRGADGRRGEATAAAGMRRTPTDEIGRQVVMLAPVVIKSECFVGAHAVILPGVTMGPATWLGPGAVARRALDPGRVYQGPDPAPAS